MKTRYAYVTEPLGQESFQKIDELLGHRFDDNKSLHLRIALFALANMSPEDVVAWADKYHAESGRRRHK